MSPHKWMLTSVVLLGAVLIQPAVVQAEAGKGTGAEIERIGKPSWKPVDFNVFSAPIGTAETGYAEFGDTNLSLLPPPNHVPHPQLGVGPGAPHEPPYRHELSDGVDAGGYLGGRCFTPEQFSNGEGVFAAWMVIPLGRHEVGSSPDFARGPIIPNSLFPIHVEGITYRDGEVFNPFLFNGDVPALDDQLSPPFDVEGHSHFPLFIADNADFGPSGVSLAGDYTYEITMLDSAGEGWSIEVSFVVREQC